MGVRSPLKFSVRVPRSAVFDVPGPWHPFDIHREFVLETQQMFAVEIGLTFSLDTTRLTPTLNSQLRPQGLAWAPPQLGWWSPWPERALGQLVFRWDPRQYV